MAKWIDVMPMSALPEGRHTVIVLGDTVLILTNISGRFYAVENVCSHDGGELSGGEISGDEITCPRHGARFCLKNGEALCAPAFEDIDAYPVRVRDGRVEVFDEPQ